MNDYLKYHQERDAAVGTKYSPPYTNLIMAGFGNTIFNNNMLKPFLWLYNLDGIFSIWKQGRKKLNEFYNCRNDLHATIKFTVNPRPKEITF